MRDGPPQRERTSIGIPLVTGPSRRPRPHVLEQIGGPGAPRRIELQEDRIVIGREGDIAIASPQLSRTHLCLTRNGSDFGCVDMDSRNGVYLNGIRIHSAVLREGDQLQLGDVILLYFAGV
ncbi:MAG TPA: FHA domain-containing protein [Vulgatibacter sp.]|nr:FHA domain-containing protein [Vulgatibacter sp.]